MLWGWEILGGDFAFCDYSIILSIVLWCLSNREAGQSEVITWGGTWWFHFKVALGHISGGGSQIIRDNGGGDNAGDGWRATLWLLHLTHHIQSPRLLRQTQLNQTETISPHVKQMTIGKKGLWFSYFLLSGIGFISLSASMCISKVCPASWTRLPGSGSCWREISGSLLAFCNMCVYLQKYKLSIGARIA